MNALYPYITLYVTTWGRQMTRVMCPARQGTSNVRYIAHYLGWIAELALQIEICCLDREFYTQKVFELLTQIWMPSTIPVRTHGKRMKELLHGMQSQYAEYRMNTKPPGNVSDLL
jgi:putative transposase